MVPHVSDSPARTVAGDELAVAVYGIRLRAEGVRYFLGEARATPTRTTLSALRLHASWLRERATRAHADMRGIADSGRQSL